MAGIVVLAKALHLPLRDVSHAIYRAPTILARGLPRDRLPELVSQCRLLGLEIDQTGNDAEPPETGPLYQIAVHVEDAARIPHAIDVLSRVTGVSAEQAFHMLSTPPGRILGQVSAAAVTALRDRFGSGIEILEAVEGAGPFDLYLTRPIPGLDPRIGDRAGLVLLGLGRDEAEGLHARLPKGQAQIVPRALLRFDVVLGAHPSLPRTAVPVLAELFGVPPLQATGLQVHAPLALAERLTFYEAEPLMEGARAADLPVSLEASGFERCALIVETVSSRAAAVKLLAAAGLELPGHLPARVAESLDDLHARWLAHALEQAGAKVRFAEVSA